MRIALVYNLKRNETTAEAEFDAPSTIKSVQQALESGGHQIDLHPLHNYNCLGKLRDALTQFVPDLVFNMAEGWSGPLREAQFPLLYESLGIPYTGPSPRALSLTQDKYLTKLVVSAMVQPDFRFKVPHHCYMKPEGKVAVGGFIDLTDERRLIVKPSCAGSSQGITEKSVCSHKWRAEAKSLLRKFPDGVLVEQFIPGCDVTVACAGGGVLPPIVFETLEDKQLLRDVYTRVRKSVSSDTITAVPLQNWMNGTSEVDRVREIAEEILLETLGDLSFGRVDFRMGEDGVLYFLEVNGLPCLDRCAGPQWPEAEGVFPVAARAAGTTYEKVILSMVDSAVRRFKIKGVTK